MLWYPWVKDAETVQLPKKEDHEGIFSPNIHVQKTSGRGKQPNTQSLPEATGIALAVDGP